MSFFGSIITLVCLFCRTRGGFFEGECSTKETKQGGAFDRILSKCPLRILNARSGKLPDSKVYEASSQACASGCNCHFIEWPAVGATASFTMIGFGEAKCASAGGRMLEWEFLELAGSLYLQRSRSCELAPCTCPSASASCRYRCDSIASESCGNQLRASLGKKGKNGKSPTIEGGEGAEGGNGSDGGDGSSSGLGVEAIAGIASGVVGVIGVLLAAVALYYQKRSVDTGISAGN